MAQIELETDLLDFLSFDSDKKPDPMSDFTGIRSDFTPSSTSSSQAGEATLAGGLASAPVDDNLSEVGGDSSVVSDAAVPNDFGGYIQRFKEVFIKSRSLEEIRIYAQGMSFRDYLDYVVKLLPKDVKIQGEFSFIHQLELLGPINKTEYLLRAPDAVEAEFCEVGHD